MVQMFAVIVVGLAFIAGPVLAADKPNILIIWGDDIGTSTSAHTTGHDGLQDAEHRQYREGRRAVH